jgi:hypothetical protein
MRHMAPFLAILAFFMAAQVFAQQAYKLPPKEVVDILDAPPTPLVSESPTGNLLAPIEYEPTPAIADLARPILRIAGSRITPANNSRQIRNFCTAISLKDSRTGTRRGSGSGTTAAAPS